VATDAIITRLLSQALFDGQPAACLTMTGQAPLAVVRRPLLGRGPLVDHMATDACQPTLAGLIALAQLQRGVLPPERSFQTSPHRRKSFQAIRFRALTFFHGALEYRYRLVKGSSRPEIEKISAGLQDARIPSLMAIHADVISQAGRKSRWIHDRCVRLVGICSVFFRHFLHVQLAGTVTAFAADG
jgi:hypothetical protein